MLQSNATLETIKKSLIKKVLGELKKLRVKNPEGYAKFFENYGAILKEGVYYEADIKQDIAQVLEFDTLLGDKKITLDEYLEALSPTLSQREKEQTATGVFFEEQTLESLQKAIDRFESMTFDSKTIRKNAERFDKKIFQEKLVKFIGEKLDS